MGHILQYALSLSDKEALFSRRGFHEATPDVRDRLERIGRVFIVGYNEALATNDLAALERRLEKADEELRGFAFEGAATALTLLDYLTPWTRLRLQAFLAGPGARHLYMVHIGIGWAIARIPWLRRRLDNCLLTLDPLLRWLVIDGYGFNQGYFHWQRSIRSQLPPPLLSKYALRVFDQGLGRSLWFVDGADVYRIPETIASFPEKRRADLWSGVGLACTYAGGVDHSALESLRRAAGGCARYMAQGAAFAAKARQRAGNQAEHTETGCRLLCGLSAEAAARVTDEALEHLPSDAEEPAYEIWRKKIQAKFVTEN